MEVRNETRHEVVLQNGYSGIELRLECGEIDLHNFANFCGYQQTGNEVHFCWRESKPNQLFIRIGSGKHWSKQVIRELIWVFDNANVTEKAQHDPDMPTSEDETLAEYHVLANTGSRCTVEFVFHGGVVLEVSGSTQFAFVS